MALRAALIGCGPRGAEHAHAIRRSHCISLAGVCDRDPVVLAPAIRSLEVPGYASVAELCQRTAPQIVIIATPPRLRAAIVREVVEHSSVRAVVIEKPLALTFADAQAIVEACASHSILGVVCHQLRHAPEFVTLKQAIDAGDIGNIEFLRGICYGNLLNQGIHLIDLMRWLAGHRLVRWVMSQKTRDLNTLARLDQGEQPGMIDAAHPAPMWMTHHLAMDGGLRASLETGVLYTRSRTFQGDWLQKRVQITGSDGMAESQAASHCRVLSNGKSWRTHSFNLADYQSATLAFYQELVRALNEDGAHRNDVRDAILSLEATLACMQSADQGDVCALPLASADSSTSQPTTLRSDLSKAAPDFSVIIPLPDHRGLAMQCVASFAQQQTLPRDRYELILLSDGAEPALDERLRQLLGPDDQLHVHATDNETLLYDMGARRARGKMLLFSEPHCIAEPQCLAELAQYLATHAVDGACLRSVGIAPNWMARLEEKQYNQGFAEFSRAGDWRKVILRGIAIDRQAYLESGGFQHEFGRFAEWALGARLHAQGRRLGYAAGAAVQHLYTTAFGQLLPHVLSFSAGEILYRDHQPAEYCDHYFGMPAEWPQRNLAHPEVAQALCRAFSRRLWRWGEWRDKGRLLRSWLKHRLSAGFGCRLRRWGASLSIRWAMLRCWLARSDASYWHMYQQIARLGRLQGLAQRALYLTPALTEPGDYPIATLPDDGLIGFHAKETYQGDVFRWTGPFAAFQVALPAGAYELTLDTRGLDGAKTWQSLHMTQDGRTAPCEVDGAHERLRCRFTIAPERAHARTWIALTCRPLQPWKHGQPDARELGVPIFSVRVEETGAAARRIIAARLPVDAHLPDREFMAANRAANPDGQYTPVRRSA